MTKDLAIRILSGDVLGTTEQTQKAIAMAVQSLEEAPTVDVPDRKVGKWVWMGDKGDSRWMCSVCKSKEDVPTIMGKPIVWDYCPNCGARMKGESDEHTGTD